MIIDSTGRPVALQGLNGYHINWDTSFMRSFSDTDYPNWNPTQVNAFFAWYAAQGFNFVRFQMNLTSARDDPTYRSRLDSMLTIAEAHGVYVMLCAMGLCTPRYASDNGIDVFSYRDSPQPYTPYVKTYNQVNTTALFNTYFASLAALCATHKNAILENWNEPNFGGYKAFNRAAYNNYNANLPATIKAARNAGFTGLIYLMSSGPNLWTDDTTDGGKVRPDATMQCAIDNLSLFTNKAEYGEVAFDWHYYYILVTPWHWPEDYAGLKYMVMVEARIAEAQNMGIPVSLFETGILLRDRNNIPYSAEVMAKQYMQHANMLKLCNETGQGWATHTLERGDGWTVLNAWNVLNQSGIITKNSVTAYPPAPTLKPNRIPLMSLGLGVVTVVGATIYKPKSR